jgi:YhcH/YjgK/YiaL family protein
MKKIIGFMVIAGLIGTMGCSSDPSEWSDEKVNKWFEQGEWLNGWTVGPDASINKREFAVSYLKNKERWDKVFTYLKSSDLPTLAIKRHEIDGDNAYALVSEYLSKTEEEGKFELHQRYIDIQHVIAGEEKIGLTPLANRRDVITPYNDKNDIEFLTVSDSDYHKATPANFFIFFPADIHKPGMRTGQDGVTIRKIVVKVKID